MRNSIIIPSKFEDIFRIEAKKCGLIKLNEEKEREYIKSLMEFAPSMVNKNYEAILEKKYSKCYKTRQKLFQMILLYDEIILSKSEPQYHYDDLENIGNFTIYSFEDFFNYHPRQEEEHLFYANYLKPAIMPVLKREYKELFPRRIKGISLNSILSDLYDFVLGITNTMYLGTVLSIEKNKETFATAFNEIFLGEDFFSDGIKRPEFYREIFSPIETVYEDLCWELEISLKNDSYIINSEYDLSKIGCDIYSKDINTQHQAYEIIKLECSKTIGNLPHMNNLTDVLTLKEKRKTDIKNLREVLCNLETIIKEQGTENAVIKAANDVQKAAKSLSKGNTLADVGKWLTMISVPISVAEALYSLPPTSSLISVCGAGICLCEQFYKNKGGWCEVVR